MFDISKKSSTFVFMRLMVLLFSFIPLIGFSQLRQPETPFEHRMDSLAMANFRYTFSGPQVKSHILAYQPVEWVKFTFKSSINPSMIGKVNFSKIGVDEIGSSLIESDLDDYLSFGLYDIRGRFYFNKHTYIVVRMLATGISHDSYLYSIGFKHRF